MTGRRVTVADQSAADSVTHAPPAARVNVKGPCARARRKKLAPESSVCELSLVDAGANDGDGCRIIIVPATTIGKGARTRGSVTNGQDVELPMSFEVRAGDKRSQGGRSGEFYRVDMGDGVRNTCIAFCNTRRPEHLYCFLQYSRAFAL